ncbi:CobO2: predicted cob(I)yrinic acid a,c-diamide adenosyltransferase [Desulfococcus multivorans]|nr:CobO2: predicted cob(I)yrinic acid a,c-diamide adenosyltransferase [Desulfococcus multivorans]
MEQYGNDDFVMDHRMPDADDIAAAQMGMERAEAAMADGKYNIVILDEICVAIYYGLLKTDVLLQFLEGKPHDIELILTGRYCPPELMEKADLVTEMKEIRHYYQKGIPARKGIEN